MISLRSSNFCAAAELSDFLRTHDERGAAASFIGTVRPNAPAEKVVSLFLEHHPTLTERSIDLIVRKALSRWDLISYFILHRVGTVNAGEDIVLVAATALHRRDSFEAVDFIMDHLKSDALFWKKQITSDSEEWIEPGHRDYHDKLRWSSSAGDR
ncbi:MAG: molybdenum cofactor biosynthesis protein MoaE [Aquisalinus sp.]|nr:molybdenum cofactor biosynthesis protein MoaE [Aquisalinus sp.]